MSENRIRVLIADDQALFAESLSYVIEKSSGDMDIVGIAKNGLEAIALAEELNPDVILMDVRMPEMDGVDATRIINEKTPKVKVLMLSTFVDNGYVRSALSSGARGYILKSLRPQELFEAIRAVNQGSTLLSESIAALLVDDKSRASSMDPETFLSNREREVASLMARSYNNKQIAEALHIGEQTVRNYTSSIYFKLDLADRFEFMQKMAGRFIADGKPE